MTYFKLTIDFVNQYNGYSRGVNKIDMMPDVNGDYYLSTNAENVFPELDFSEFEIVELESN